MAMGSTEGILKYACKCFLGGAISSVFRIGVGGTPGLVRSAPVYEMFGTEGRGRLLTIYDVPFSYFFGAQFEFLFLVWFV